MSSESMGQRKSRRPFYGYHLVAITFIFMLLSYGSGSFVFSLFVHPLQSTFGWGRGQVMVGFTIFFAVQGLVSPFVGRLVDRHGSRRVIPLGALAMGLGFVLVSRTGDLLQFYVSYVIIGAGSAGMGIVPCSAVVSNWFRRKRGVAVGVMASGMGAGGFVMAPVVAHFLESYDWRTAYFAMAVIVCAVTIPLALALIRTRPSDMGLYPDGDSIAPDEAQASLWAGMDREGLSLRQSARTVAIYLIGISFFVSGFSNTGALHAPVPFLEDIGFPTATAALALGTLGLGSALGKVFFGWLCDRIPPKRACAVGLTLQLCGVLVLLTIRADSSLALIWAYALLLGFGIGSWLPSMSTLVSKTFGLAHYGSIFGVIAFLESTGTSLGPLFAGLMFDATGTYYHAFVTFAVLYAVAIPAVLLVKKPNLSMSGA
ncbi:MAG: MFS transporter [Dehalococcoidia bacterium]|nr:MFS transporter [Dehalococcoidia bacterium]